MHKRKFRGNTLVEVLIVATVIGMIGYVAFTVVPARTNKRFQHATAAQVLSIGKSLPAYARKDFASCVRSQEGGIDAGHVYLSQVQACALKARDMQAHVGTSAQAINQALTGLTAAAHYD